MLPKPPSTAAGEAEHHHVETQVDVDDAEAEEHTGETGERGGQPEHEHRQPVHRDAAQPGVSRSAAVARSCRPNCVCWNTKIITTTTTAVTP
jgi:hypothetical protein